MSKRQSVKAAVDAALLSARVDQAMANNKSVTVHVSVPNTRGIKENSVVSSVDVTEDTIMTSHNGINDDSDLRDRAQATLVAEMSNVSVEDDIDIMQNMAAQECKFDAVFSAPPTMSTNSICVPIVVQDVICFGLVDTGATFSCITNEFFQFLGGSSLGTFKASDDDSVVQLAHEVTTVPREGTVDLNVSYNKYNKSHIFEVFSFYSEENVHVLLGMDILSKLGIGITGLVSRHGFQTGLRMPDPIDDSIEPNAHPFDQNSQIDMKNTQCNLPDSIIKLDTKPGCIAWRAQYPLPEAYRDAVGKQIQVWLDEGVITRSASHTRFNHPLLVVKKKDADGNYSMSKPRVVCDVRKLNAILEVDDKQQLPLISTIHQNIDSRQAHKVSFTCPFSNVQYTHKKAAYGIRHVGAVVVRTLQTLLSDLNTPLSS
ncbi:hypothetical protein INT46_009424, partial [Mucor plumbeus]